MTRIRFWHRLKIRLSTDILFTSALAPANIVQADSSRSLHSVINVSLNRNRVELF